MQQQGDSGQHSRQQPNASQPEALEPGKTLPNHDMSVHAEADREAGAAASTIEQSEAHPGAGPALLVDVAHTSSHDSAGTGMLHNSQQKGPAKQMHGQAFVPRKDTHDNVPCFVQTSALFTNMCGYCGTRSTSGCWRRGWEVAPNKFINLCNKCGLRHKAGKLPSVPEPPPPQLRGRAAAAAAAAATAPATMPGGTGYGGLGTSGLHHSTSAAEIIAMTGGQASPNGSAGHETAASDPTTGNLGRAGSGGGSRSRRVQKLLTPKWSRVAGASASDFSQDHHMFAQLLAAGAFGNGSNSMNSYGSMAGMLPADQQQQQQQQQLAALLQSLVEPGGAAAPPAHGTYGGMAGEHTMPGYSLHNSHHQSDNHNSLSLSHFTAATQQAAAPTGSAPTTGGAAAMDSAQAVAAVLAAAAAAATSSDSKGPALGSKLSKLSVVSGFTAPEGSQLSSPAHKKRRTKKEAAEEDAPSSAAAAAAATAEPLTGNAQVKAAQDAAAAAAAGDAADALLALRSSAKPESPSWARLQPSCPANRQPPRGAPATNMSMEHIMQAMNASRQVTSPSIDTTGGGTSKSSPLAHYLQPLQPQQGASQMQMAPPHAVGHPHPYSSHLQPLPAAGPGSPVHDWSPEQLHSWLQQCGCAELVPGFKALGMDGVALSGLLRVAQDAGAARLNDVLKADCGVGEVALRLRLVESVMSELCGNSHRGSM